MMDFCSDILRKLARPLEPEPTDTLPVLRPLSGIRAVMFDLYGTLFISGSGEVGTVRQNACQQALAEALQAVGIEQTLGIDWNGLAAEGVRSFFQAVENSHARSRRRGIEYPEIDVVAIWREVVDTLAVSSTPIGKKVWSDDRLRRLAVEYEGRSNPVWPMPGIRECLSSLSGKGLTLGIISNAQFYTPKLFDALLGGPPSELGIDPSIEYYSYRFGHAKPGLKLHQAAADGLRGRGIESREVLYVGNDMLNDVYPSVRVGFRTALFAGDKRSLRWRPEESRLEGISPDLVLTELAELPGSV